MKAKEKRLNDHPLFSDVVLRITGDEKLGNRLLTLLGAPPPLIYLLDGLERSRVIFSDRDYLLPEIIDLDQAVGYQLPELLKLIDVILEEENEIEAAIGERVKRTMDRVSENDSHPFQYYCLGTSVYWCGLFYKLDPGFPINSIKYDNFYSELGAHFLALNARVEPERYSVFMSEWSSKGNLAGVKKPQSFTHFDNRLAYAGRAARLLTLPKHWKTYDALMDVDKGDRLEERLFAAMDQGEARWDKSDWEILNNLALLFIETVKGWQRPNERNRTDRQERKTKSKRSVRDFKDGFVRISGTDWNHERLNLGEEWDIEMIRQRIPDVDDSDDTPADDQFDTGGYVLVTEGETHEASRAVRTVTARRRARHISRYHQSLPLAYSSVTDTELLAVTRWVKSMATSMDPNSLEYPIVPLIFSASLSLGRGLDEIAGVKLGIESDAPSETPVFLVDRGDWRIPLNGPDYAKGDHVPVATEFPVATHLIIPDYGHFAELLHRTGLSEHQGRLVTAVTTNRIKQIKACLKSIRSDDRLRPQMLSHPMFSGLLNASGGDLAVATMLTNRRFAHSASVLYYTTYSDVHLLKSYNMVAKKIWARSPREMPQELEPYCQPINPRYYGARKFPRPEAIRQLFEALRTPLLPSKLGDAMAYHNDYTVYTVAVLTLSLAYRAVISPSFLGWDTQANLVTFQDKARTPYHRRYSFLPPVAETHLLHYADHRQAMIANSKEFAKIDDDGTIFALWQPEKSQFDEFRPKHFDDYSGDFGMPLYSLRRYMRTALICDHGAHAETLDAWFGHWHLGLSPHESMSTFSPKAIQDLADGPVTRILKDLGCQAFMSRLVDDGR